MDVVKDEVSCFSSTGADGYAKLLRAVLLDHGVAEEISG